MKMGICGLFSIFLTLVASSLEETIIYTNPDVRPETPVCGRGDFCNIEIRAHPDVNGSEIIYSSRILVCRCPQENSQDNVTCPIKWGASNNTVFRHLHNSAQNLSMTVSYCEPLSTVRLRRCRRNEEVLTLRGYSIPFRLENQVKCNCTKKLFISRSYTNGTDTVKTYTCGKTPCDPNRTNPTPCVRVFARENPIPDNGIVYEEEHPCRCRFKSRSTRRRQECFIHRHTIPTTAGRSANGYCRDIEQFHD